MWEQIREILQADRAIGAQGAAEDESGPNSSGSSRGADDAGAAKGLDWRAEGLAALPDQALRRSSSDSWRSADSQLDVDTDSEGGLSKEGMSDATSPASSSGAALAQSAEPKEVEVVKQESSYRPIMWCVLAAYPAMITAMLLAPGPGGCRSLMCYEVSITHVLIGKRWGAATQS